MKTILVLDETPETCERCRLRVNDCCRGKPMPKKKVFAEGLNDFQKGTKRGWNDCIDEILGEEE